MARFSQSGGGNPDLNLIKTKNWGYPTPNSVAIVPAQTGETIALKSSGGAQLRWHIRDSGRAVIDYQVNITSIANINYADYNGMSYVTFNIDPQDIPLPGGVYYDINVNSGNTDFAGSYECSGSDSINTIILIYSGDISGWDITGFTATLGLPSIYSQVQVDSNGVWIKNDNWSQSPYENVWWQFQRDGGLRFPDNSVQYSANSANSQDIYYATNNTGAGTNFAVGDDTWLGDINQSNVLGIKGQQDGTVGYIQFGHNGVNLGSNSTGVLTWGSNPVVTDVAVPTSHLGQAGDKRGQIATDTAYIYFCTQDYNGNGAAIWRRIATDPVWNW